MTKEIYITKKDQEQLLKLLNKIPNSDLRRELKNLQKEIERARVVDSTEVPGNAITMNSEVLFEDVETGKEMKYTLVYPENADLEKNKISIFSPVGTALLGYVEGDEIEWPVPSGVKKIRVKKILFQPEASGDYSL